MLVSVKGGKVLRYLKTEITVPGQLTGSAVLTSYLLDQIEVRENKRRPAVIVCPGGGYKNRSDRESEPIITQFLAMGCHGFLLDYSVAPNRFPTSLLELANLSENRVMIGMLIQIRFISAVFRRRGI